MEEESYVEEDNLFWELCSIAIEGIRISRTLHNTRISSQSSYRSGHMFIHDILKGHERRCYEVFRLHVPLYRMLCSDLVTHYGLQPTRGVSVEESVAIFLMILAHGCGNRLVQETFSHSRETVHRHFYKVLKAVLKLSADIIRPQPNYNDEVPSQILNNPRYYPEFKDCIGAIDGTHVKASVHEQEKAKFIGRKGYATQNIMAACDFNMCFTFALAGWEGTAHDTRIFNEALHRPELNFPHPDKDRGKYYVVDVGYPNTRGYLAPYKGTNLRYHLPDFRRGQTSSLRRPRGGKENFNYYHSSLRNVIERTFGVWKAWWAILKDMHVNVPYTQQVNIVIGSMAIHNYIRQKDNTDVAFNTAQQESYNPPVEHDPQGVGETSSMPGDSSSRRRDDDAHMIAVRDMIAGDLMMRGNNG